MRVDLSRRIPALEVSGSHRCRVAGRVVAVRCDGPRATLCLRDESGELPLLVLTAEPPPRGAWITACGSLGGTGTFCVDTWQVLSAPQREGESPEWDRRDWRDRRRFLELRHRVLDAVRAGFRSRGFLEVETPALLEAPGQEPHLEPFETRWCGSPRYLATSPEYAHKRLLAAGFARIFELARVFRHGRDELSAHHQPEFTLLEWYRAFGDLEALRADVHWLLRETCLRATGGTVAARGDVRVDLDAPPRWLTVEEAFQRHAALPLGPYLDGDDAGFLAAAGAAPGTAERAREAADSLFFRVLVEKVEPQLGHPEPVLLCEYPARHAALAELHPQDPRVAQRFELYVAGIELANAFQELGDEAEQRRRFERERAERRRHGGGVLPLCERFLAALGGGMPPAAGIALGMDRLVMLLAGAERVGDVLAFPHEDPPAL